MSDYEGKDMSRQHELWIRDLLNFLNTVGAPIYRHDKNGDKQGAAYDIPARLRWVVEELATQRLAAHRLRRDIDSATRGLKDRISDLERVLNLAYRAVVPEEGSPRFGEAIMLLDNMVNPGEKGEYFTPLRTADVEKDARGVRRVKIDGRDALLRLGVAGIIHDLNEDEEICPECSGIGLCKVESQYGKGDKKPHEDAFPYAHQWLAPCPNCYMGKVRLCREPSTVHDESVREIVEELDIRCGLVIPRNRTMCDCEAAVARAAAERATREEARRAKLTRIPFAKYEGDMVWCGDSEKFLCTDEVDEHLEEHPDEVFFACTPAAVDCKPTAESVIENIRESAWDEAGPEYDDQAVDFTAGAEAALEAALAAWFEEHVRPKELWWPKMNLIVEVSRGT